MRNSAEGRDSVGPCQTVLDVGGCRLPLLSLLDARCVQVLASEGLCLLQPGPGLRGWGGRGSGLPGDRAHLSVLFLHHNITLLEGEDWLLPPSPVPHIESCSTGHFLQPVSQTNEHMMNAGRTCQEGTGLCHLSEKTMGMSLQVDSFPGLFGTLTFDRWQISLDWGQSDSGGLRKLPGGGLFELDPGGWK